MFPLAGRDLRKAHQTLFRSRGIPLLHICGELRALLIPATGFTVEVRLQQLALVHVSGEKRTDHVGEVLGGGTQLLEKSWEVGQLFSALL